MSLEAHGATHPGRRSSNEDALFVGAELGLFVVADGMGGHRAGEVASRLAVDVIRHSIATAGAGGGALLEAAVRLANERVLSAGANQPRCEGMGTTVVAVLVRDEDAHFVSVGDSRLYRWRRGRLTQLTRDDTWVRMMVSDPPLTARELQQHPMRHVLTEVVGARADLQPRAEATDLVPGDVLLLCSDGLHATVPDGTLGERLGRPVAVAEIATTLVEDALERGASDNITAIVVRRER